MESDHSQLSATIKSIFSDSNEALGSLLGNKLPKPKHPEKCPLFSVFYSEFDIKKGPVIGAQTPIDFMDQDINISTEKIHAILSDTFASIKDNKSETEPSPEKDSRNENTDDPGVSLHEGGHSIFDSTSEFIITGSELTGKIITLSTHEFHIITRPTLISDERYERNSLLFSVGMVLRRAADPRPFRPLISKLALTLRSMEEESQFLSDPLSRKQLQPLLERILLSMNSSVMECNLLLSQSNALNLKIFQPPKPEVPPVLDHEVPILLRRDLQLQMYEWDLSINWCLMHIDGVTTTHQISIKAEVDLEMVRACLRVLKHHGIITMVDMFVYTNKYEFTSKATAMLAGKESKLLQDAMDFVIKKSSLSSSTAVVHGDSSTDPSQGISPNQFTPGSSYPPRNMSLLGSSHKSSNFKYAMMLANSLENEVSISIGDADQRNIKMAISELYCACNRNISFGELWVALTQKKPVRRRSSILEENDRGALDSLAISPIETFQRVDGNRKHSFDGDNIDWDIFFRQFDHRRFISFGIVNGLIHRVHEYPYFPGIFPKKKPFVAKQGSTKQKKSELAEEKAYQLARHVSSLMDGTRCDDEFACIFEKPYVKLVHLVEKYGERKIVSIHM